MAFPSDQEYAKALDNNQIQYPPQYQQEPQQQQYPQQYPQPIPPPIQQLPQEQQYPYQQFPPQQQQFPAPYVPPDPYSPPQQAYPYQQFPQQQIPPNQPPTQQLIIVQQGQQQQQDLGPQFWKNPLCGCMKDCPTCCLSYFCCFFLLFNHSTAVEKATRGDSSCGIACLLDCIGCCCINRQSIRQAYKIEGSLFEDVCYSTFCTFCTLMQEVYEVKDRG